MTAITALLVRIAKAVENPILADVQRPVDNGHRSIVIENRVYDSPKLFLIIDWLKANPDKQEWSVREIASVIDVSKSWVAIAKKYKGG